MTIIHYLGALDDLDLGGELDPAAHPQPGALIGLPDRPVAHAARVVRHLDGRIMEQGLTGVRDELYEQNTVKPGSDCDVVIRAE